MLDASPENDISFSECESASDAAPPLKPRTATPPITIPRGDPESDMSMLSELSTAERIAEFYRRDSRDGRAEVMSADESTSVEGSPSSRLDLTQCTSKYTERTAKKSGNVKLDGSWRTDTTFDLISIDSLDATPRRGGGRGESLDVVRHGSLELSKGVDAARAPSSPKARSPKLLAPVFARASAVRRSTLDYSGYISAPALGGPLISPPSRGPKNCGLDDAAHALSWS